jgi:serine/threonine-protein kinase
MDPTQIGPYQILEKIGSGGMGNVYLGRPDGSARVVAVKVLTASLARESGFVERFNREIDAMRKLKNPHIVELFENGVDNENYYYAMEYVAGETLLSLMRREKRIPWKKTLDIAGQVCQALKAAHDAGIIHRDLKPSNLLLTPEGVVKLTDFGVAQVFAASRLTVTGGIIGTAEYMSPEQAQGKRAGKQSDLYSLGAVMYAMITGRTPFAGSTAVEVIQKHKFGLFDRPKLYVPELPERVDETICRLLEKEPEKRFPDALVLHRHLEQIVRLEDFAAMGATLAGDSVADPGAPTVAVTERSQSVSAAHPGPATMMQKLMRSELAEPQGPLAAFFNNIYVLIALLVLVILGGIWWFRPPDKPTPQQMFDQAAALLEQDPGPDWLRARREYLEPLLALDSEGWQEQVAPLLKKIDLYELSRPARAGRANKSAGLKSEGERQLQLALHYRQIGDLSRAERMLAALQVLLAGDERQAALRQTTGRLLEETRRQLVAAADRDEWIKSALDRAAALARDGSISQAREIWESIVDLYSDDVVARDYVRLAEDGLEVHPDPKAKSESSQ